MMKLTCEFKEIDADLAWLNHRWDPIVPTEAMPDVRVNV
jgi:hypothetical protein